MAAATKSEYAVEGDTGEHAGTCKDKVVPYMKTGVFALLPRHIHELWFPNLQYGCVGTIGTWPDGNCHDNALSAATNARRYLATTVVDRKRVAIEVHQELQRLYAPGTLLLQQSKFPEAALDPVRDTVNTAVDYTAGASQSYMRALTEALGANMLLFLDDGTIRRYKPAHTSEEASWYGMILVKGCHYQPLLFVTERSADHVHVQGLVGRGDPVLLRLLRDAYDRLSLTPAAVRRP
jgi:hypothetical protein